MAILNKDSLMWRTVDGMNTERQRNNLLSTRRGSGFSSANLCKDINNLGKSVGVSILMRRLSLHQCDSGSLKRN